jgi:hypothetical protein
MVVVGVLHGVVLHAKRVRQTGKKGKTVRAI